MYSVYDLSKINAAMSPSIIVRTMHPPPVRAAHQSHQLIFFSWNVVIVRSDDIPDSFMQPIRIIDKSRTRGDSGVGRG